MNAFIRGFHRRLSLQVLLAVALGSLFVFSGWTKLNDISGFASDIANYRVLPETWTIYVASWLPWLEIVTGFAVVVGPFRLGASAALLTMMTLFTAIVAVALARGLDISCGCFGKDFEEYLGSGGWALGRDIVLLVLSAILYRLIYIREFRSLSVAAAFRGGSQD
jgi:uncharacterized membrane protein YphA (DoxX/SURF4 family)